MSRQALPKNYILPGAVVLNDCSDASEWSQGGGDPIAFVNSTEHNTEGNGSQKLVIPDAAVTGVRDNYISGMGWNLTHNLISLKVGSASVPSDKQGDCSIQLFLGSNVGSRFSDYIISRALYAGDKWPDDLVTLDLDSATDFPTISGSFDRADVQFCTIRINNTNTADEKTLYFDGIYSGLKGRIKYLLNWDDNYESIYTTLFPLTQARDIQCTMFVTTSSVGEAGRMTAAQLTELQDAGWQICHHSYEHIAWTLRTKAEMTQDFLTAKAWLIANGFEWDYHAFVGGAWNEEALEVLAEQGVKMSRTTREELNGTHPKGGFSSAFDGLNKYELRCDDLGLTYTETAAVALAYLDDCIRLGYNKADYGHIIVASPSNETEFSTAEMALLLDGLVTRRDQGLIDIVTFKQFYEGLAGLRQTASRVAASSRIAASRVAA